MPGVIPWSHLNALRLTVLKLYVHVDETYVPLALGADITCDDRSCAMYRASTADVSTSVVYTYPRLLPLHRVSEDRGCPAPLRASIDKMNEQGVYLLGELPFI